MGILHSIGSALKSVASSITEIYSEITKIAGVFINIRDYTIGAFEDAVALISEVEDEYDKIIHFDIQPHWRSRVISVPRVMENIKQLAALPQIVINAVKDLISNFKTRMQSTEVIEVGEEFLPILGQVFAIATLIAEILLAIRSTIDDVKAIVDAIQTVREDLENLDGLFLPQHNARKFLSTRRYARIKG
jgi:hypothetical protein